MASELKGTKNQPYFSAAGAPAIDVDPGIVADYAAYVGNHKEGTSAERGALAGADLWDGLLFTETDTGLIWSYLLTSQGGWFCVSGISKALVTTFGTNWSSTAPTAATCYRTGNRVDLVGTVLLGASGGGGGYSNILTVPAAMRPPTATQRFVGAAVTSTGAAYELGLTSGVLAQISGYVNGSLTFGTRTPLHCFWYLD